MSVADVAKLYGCSKHKILVTLKQQSVHTRPKRAVSTVESARYKGKGSCKPFFGFCYSEGRITKHPIEFPILQVIHQRWGSGVSTHYITLELNKKKVASRIGRKWSWAAVQNIVNRFKSGESTLGEGGGYGFS